TPPPPRSTLFPYTTLFRSGHMAHPRRKPQAVRKTCNDESVAMTLRAVGFSTLRHAQDDFALPPDFARHAIRDRCGSRHAPALDVGELTLDELGDRVSCAPMQQ